MKAAFPFAVMAKPVGPRCNLECRYCYYLGKEPLSAQPRMAGGTLEAYIRQYIQASEGPYVQFTWHGGEPALAGLDFYRRAVELQKRWLPAGWECWNNLQTNGLLLDDDWCEFLSQAGFDIGLSIDGSQRAHDAHRRSSSGGTYEQAVAAVRRLQAHGVQPDLLCTVNSATVAEPFAVYKALKGLGTGWIQFIPVALRDADGGVAPESVTAEGYGNFLCAVFDEWSLHDLGRTEVQLFAETARVWSGGAAGLCWMAPVCGRVPVVEQDGGVYSCDHFVDPEHRIGSILESPIETLVDSAVQTRFGEAKKEGLSPQCLECPWKPVCNGGCPKDRFVSPENGGPPLNYLCAGLKRFFSHAEKPLKKIARQKRAGATDEAVMSGLRRDMQELWRGVGRNDPCPCGSGLKAKHCCWNKRP
jgi:uncharacterized protein